MTTPTAGTLNFIRTFCLQCPQQKCFLRCSVWLLVKSRFAPSCATNAFAVHTHFSFSILARLVFIIIIFLLFFFWSFRWRGKPDKDEPALLFKFSSSRTRSGIISSFDLRTRRSRSPAFYFAYGRRYVSGGRIKSTGSPAGNKYVRDCFVICAGCIVQNSELLRIS